MCSQELWISHTNKNIFNANLLCSLEPSDTNTVATRETRSRCVSVCVCPNPNKTSCEFTLGRARHSTFTSTTCAHHILRGCNCRLQKQSAQFVCGSVESRGKINELQQVQQGILDIHSQLGQYWSTVLNTQTLLVFLQSVIRMYSHKKD